MGFELSVNLEYMFHEAGERLEDRIAAAAAAGFTKAEMFTTAGRDLAALGRALGDHGVGLISVLADPRTRLIERDTHADFRDLFRRAAEEALALGCNRVVVGSGPGVPYMKRAMQLDIVAEAVAGIVPIAQELGVVAMLEPVNTRVDHPGVLFSQTCDAVHVIKAVDAPCVRLLYDLYHSVVEGENPVEQVAQHIGLIEHVQIADAPGRAEPGSGAIDWAAMLGLLRAAGYCGAIGVECHPSMLSTPRALDYIRELAATI